MHGMWLDTSFPLSPKVNFADTGQAHNDTTLKDLNVNVSDKQKSW